MLTKVQELEIPIHRENQEVPSWGGYGRWTGKTAFDVYPNCVFEDRLVILKFGKTSSGSPYMTVQSEITGCLYPVRWMQIKDIMLNGLIERGHIHGFFTFVLKWQYYSMALFDPTKLKDHTPIKDAFWWEDHPMYVIDH